MSNNERIVTLGVIGPSPKYIGGYSRSNPTRLWVRNSLYDVFLDIKNEIEEDGCQIRLANPLTQGVGVEAAMVALSLHIPVDGLSLIHI